MKTADLIDTELDAWVARAEGYVVQDHPTTRSVWRDHGDNHPEFLGYLGVESAPPIYSPSTDWEHAGPIIESDRIMLCPRSESASEPGWVAASGGRAFVGPTALVAAMRARVGQAFGDEVPS